MARRLDLSFRDEYGHAVSTKVEEAARHLIAVDDEFPLDRLRYGSFDRMPVELREWWMRRALWRLTEAAELIGGQGK